MSIESEDLDNYDNSISTTSTNPLSVQAKVRGILSTWLNYLRLKDLTNAEVDAFKYETPYVWDQGVSLVGDKLVVERNLFKTLKQEFKTYKSKNQFEEYQIAAAFPQIFQYKQQKRKFLPLFTIDLSSIFAGNYRSLGWDLTQFEFHPVIPNLIRLYGIEEEEALRLPTREGLKVFLESIFDYPFSTLQNFLQLLELPDRPRRAKALPYLLRFGHANYNRHLKRDLNSLIEQLDWNWVVPLHPAYEYLFGKPTSPESNTVYLGAFPTVAPNQEQALALKHSSTNNLTAVIGPPGNGKTETVLHKIAHQIVKRAVKLAVEEEDESNLTVVASTNNRAVNHVELLLAEHLNTEFFYLSQAGSEPNLINGKVLPKLQAALNWLNQTAFNQTQWLKTKEQLLTAVEQFHSFQEQEQLLQQQRQAQQEHLAEVQAKIQDIETEINLLQQQQLPSTAEIDYAQFPDLVIKRIAQQLDWASSQLKPTLKPRSWQERIKHWLQSVWRYFTGQTNRAIIARLNRQILEDVTFTKTTPFPLELILNRQHLQYWQTWIAEQQLAAGIWRETQERQQHRANRLNTLQTQFIQTQQQQQQLQDELNGYDNQDFANRFYQDHHQLQVQLFELSWQFQQLEALRKKEQVTASIKTYIDVLDGNWEVKRQFRRSGQTVYRDLSLLFPVFLSTLHSLRRLFPYLHHDCIDQAIVDEAGQIAVHQPFPLLVRSRRAIFLGDPWQLEPVIDLSDEDKELYRERAFLARGLTDSDFDHYSPTAITAYHRAAGSNNSSDLGNSIMLKQHYRSVPAIARFNVRLCYRDAIIQTSPKPSLLGTNLIACHVNGNQTKHVNQAEIEVVETLVQELLQAGYSLDSSSNQNTIGVISPYRRQAYALTESLRSKWNFSSDSIGTVHTFQGGQKSVIMLSTRQCRRQDSLWFINRRPNLLNVAVSRARELFILVGNLDLLLQGEYTKLLVEYIEQFGEVRSF